MNNVQRRRFAVRLAVGAGIATSLSAVYGFHALHALMARPGEDALRLIPGDALIVGSLDLSPSASQTIAFKRIDDALARNEYGGLVEKSFIDILAGQADGVDQLRPLILRNGAMAYLPGPKGTGDDGKGLAILALKDGPAAQAILQKVGVPDYYKGLKFYKLKNARSVMMVSGDDLVVGETGFSLYQVKLVLDGTKAPVTANPNFMASRSHVADDANLMVFMSPKMVAETGKKNLDGMTNDWMAAGMAIRDGGVGLSFSGVVDTKKEPEIEAIAKAAPIREDLFKMLPSGAYGAMIISQPSVSMEAAMSTADRDESMRKGLASIEDGMQKDLGMDLKHDLLPAFKGDAIAAVYPVSGDSPAGADVLLVLDDSNGADPSNAVDRFQSWVKRQMEKEGNQQGPLWTDSTKDGAHFFKVSDKIETDMRKSMGNGMDKSINQEALVNHKTIAWAVVGKAVLASTSQELLDRAVQSYGSHSGGLDTDPKYASAQKELLDGSQSLIMFSVSRIASGVKNTVDGSHMDESNRNMFTGIIDAFSTLDQPLSIRGKAQPDGRISGGAFIPMDYDKLIDIASKAMKHDK